MPRQNILTNTNPAEIFQEINPTDKTMTFHCKTALFVSAVFLMLITAPAFAGSYETGMNYYRSKRYDKAREYLLKAKDNGNACYVLGDIAKLMGDFAEAEDWFRKAIESGSANQTNLRNAYWSLISFDEQRGEYERLVLTCKELWKRMGEQAARQKIETIINKRQWSDDKEAVEEYERGMALKQRNKPEEATDCFYEAIRLDGKFLAPKFELGIAALNGERLLDAEYYLKAVTEKIPYHAEANLALGDVYFSMKKFWPALKCYSNAEEFGILSEAVYYHINIKKAQCHYGRDELEEAEKFAQAAYEAAPNNAQPLTVLSAVYIKQGELDKAIASLKKAEAMQPENIGIQYQMGSIYYSRKDRRYMDCFDKIFVGTRDRTRPPYPKIIPILMKGHYGNKNYPRVNEIYESFPDYVNTYELKLLNAKAFYYRRQYGKAIEELKKLNLTKDDRLVLAVACVKDSKPEQAKSIVEALYGQEDYREKARKYASLAPIVKEIEQENVEAERAERERRENTERERLKAAAERAETERQDKVPADKEKVEEKKAEADGKP